MPRLRLVPINGLLASSVVFALVAAALFAPVAAAGAGAQVPPPDTIRADSVGPTAYRLPRLTVAVPRVTTMTGGSSAVEVRLDSVSPSPAPSMAEVLRAMPLVQIRTNSRGEAQPALRGARERQVAVLVDGVPLTLGWDARTDLSVIPLTAARRVRLVRGLSTILHGPNVLGGAVEVDVARGAEGFSPPDPMALRLGLDHTGARSLSATGGRVGNAGQGQWELRAGVGYQARDGHPLPSGLGADQRPRFLTRDGDLRLNSDERRVDGFGSVRFRSESGAWLSAAGSGYQVERGVPPEAHIDDPRLWRYPDQSRFILATSGGTGFHDTSLGRGDLEASLGVDLGRTEIDAFASEAFDANEVVGREDADDRTLTLRLSGDLAPGERTDLRAAATFADVFHEERIDGGPPARYRQRLWSVGFEAERRLDGLAGVPGLTGTRVVAGVAADGADTPASGDKPPLGRLWDWGARVGFSSLVEGTNALVHGSLSRRTRFPALRELYSGALGRFEPNPGLGPEELVAFEVGTSIHGEVSELQVVAFHQRLADGIARTTVMTSAGPKFQRVNQDEVRSTGLELLGRTRVGPVAVQGDLTLQRVRGRDENGRRVRIEYEPAVAAGAGAQAPLPWGLQGDAGLSWTGRQYCQNPEVAGLTAFDSAPRLDVGVARSFGRAGQGMLRRVETRVRAENVADASVFDQCGLPQPGRRLSVQVRLW